MLSCIWLRFPLAENNMYMFMYLYVFVILFRRFLSQSIFSACVLRFRKKHRWRKWKNTIGMHISWFCEFVRLSKATKTILVYLKYDLSISRCLVLSFSISLFVPWKRDRCLNIYFRHVSSGSGLIKLGLPETGTSMYRLMGEDRSRKVEWIRESNKYAPSGYPWTIGKCAREAKGPIQKCCILKAISLAKSERRG